MDDPIPKSIKRISPFSFRMAAEPDYATLAEVMYDAIWNGPSRYTDDQKRAWCPEIRSGTDWTNRLQNQWILVAESEGQVVGFMSLAAQGYIDFAYIRPSCQGTGLFRKLYEQLHTHAADLGINRLWVHASLMAQPAFTAMGFSIVQNELVEVRGQFLKRFEMEKHLA